MLTKKYKILYNYDINGGDNMYDYGYTTYDMTNSIDMADSVAVGSAFGILAGMSLIMWVISLAIGIFSIITMWKVFAKAGKPGWASLIPIYNLVVLFQVSGMSPWYILLMCIPIANLVVAILLNVKLAEKFGKTGGFAVGLIFLNVIFMAILAFGDAEYQA